MSSEPSKLPPDDPGEGPSGVQQKAEPEAKPPSKKNSLVVPEADTMDPAERDFRKEIEQLKQNGVSVSQHLIQLCRRGDWLGVDTLLRLTPYEDLNLEERAQGTGWSPVHFATKENRVNIVERLLEIGFDVNARATDGITALHLAVAYAREDTIRCLLVHKANTMIAGGPKNQLPIHILALKPTTSAVVSLQLILRSSPKDVRLAQDGEGNIPLFLSLENGNNA